MYLDRLQAIRKENRFTGMAQCLFRPAAAVACTRCRRLSRPCWSRCCRHLGQSGGRPQPLLPPCNTDVLLKSIVSVILHDLKEAFNCLFRPATRMFFFKPTTTTTKTVANVFIRSLTEAFNYSIPSCNVLLITNNLSVVSA